MIGGVGLFGALAANFASILVRRGDRSAAAIDSLAAEVRSMREELAKLREQRTPE